FKMPVMKLRLALNAHLPQDIRVMAVREVPAAFHARFHAVGKQYRYHVWNSAAMNPLLRHQAWHVAASLNLKAMHHAARLFPGKHDFQSFAGTRSYEMFSSFRRVTRTLSD